MPEIKRASSTSSYSSPLIFAIQRWTCVGLALLALAQHLRAVKITKVTVPAAVQNGTSEVIHMDCEYDVSPKDENLVIKWFLNEDPQPIYQWIPGLPGDEKGQSRSEKYGNNVVINEGLTPANNTDFRFRSLKIRSPTTEFTGNYRCEVLSLDDQDQQFARMVVFAPAKKLNFYVTGTGPKEMVNVTCEAEDVFPHPQLRVFQILQGKSNRLLLPGKKTVTNETGIFDIRTVTQIEEAKDIMYFECELQLNSTDHKQSERIQYIPEDISVNEKVIVESGEPNSSSLTIASTTFAICIFGLSFFLVNNSL